MGTGGGGSGRGRRTGLAGAAVTAAAAVVLLVLGVPFDGDPPPAAWRAAEISFEHPAAALPPPQPVRTAATTENGAPTTPGGVFGRIVDSAGAPVAGVSLELRTLRGRAPWRGLEQPDDWQGLAATVSDSAGAFELPAGPDRVPRVALVATHPGFSERTILLDEIGRGLRIDVGVVVLVPGILVEGVIRRPDGSGAAGAVVHWEADGPTSRGSVETDAAGRFVLGRFAPGMLHTTVVAGADVDELPPIALDGAEPVVHVEHELSAGVPFEVRVRSRAGTPIWGLSLRRSASRRVLRLIPTSATADESSTFRLHLPAGEMFLAEVAAEGHAPALVQVQAAERTAGFVEVVLEPVGDRLTVLLDGATAGAAYRFGVAREHGKLVDLPAMDLVRTWTGDPLEFTAGKLPLPPSAVVHVLAADGAAYGRSEPLTPEILAAGRPIRIAVQPMDEIRVRCLAIRSDGARPIAGMRVRLLRDPTWTVPSPWGPLVATPTGTVGPDEPLAEAVTDAEGRAILPKIPGVRVRIAARAEGFGPAEADASGAGEHELTLPFRPEATIVVAAPDGGDPAAVAVRRIGREAVLLRPDETSGATATFRGLLAGGYIVGWREELLRFGGSISPPMPGSVPHFLGGVAVVNVQPGDAPTIALGPPGDALVAGEVRAPFEGYAAVVDLVPEGREDAPLHGGASVDPSGRFVLGPAAPGRYVVRVWDAVQGLPLLREPVEVVAGRTCRIRLYPNVVRLRVAVAPSDQPRGIAVRPAAGEDLHLAIPPGATDVVMDLPPGEYDFALQRVDGPGRITVEETRDGLTLPPGESTLDLR